MLVETWMILRVCMVEMGLQIVTQKVKPFLNLPRASTLFLPKHFSQRDAKVGESGGVRTVVDYVLAKKNDMKDVKDVKVIPGEECA